MPHVPKLLMTSQFSSMNNTNQIKLPGSARVHQAQNLDNGINAFEQSMREQ